VATHDRALGGHGDPFTAALSDMAERGRWLEVRTLLEDQACARRCVRAIVRNGSMYGSRSSR
jgi:phosphatidylserine/phosphatidylglycerophosphate/cardiolipin synthase-like enzyme